MLCLVLSHIAVPAHVANYLVCDANDGDRLGVEDHTHAIPAQEKSTMTLRTCGSEESNVVECKAS